MTALTNLSPAASYGDLITCTNNGQGLTNILQNIQDGFGNNSAIQLSTTTLNIIGSGGLQINGNSFVPIASLPVTLTSTNIKSMYATPVPVLAAPGAALTYVIYGFSINYSYSTAAYTGGGNITLQFGSTAEAAAGVMTDSISSAIFGSSNSFGYAAGNGVILSGSQAYINTGVYISNASGAFTGSTAAGTAALTIYYQTVSAV
jgi:hypothetical protein